MFQLQAGIFRKQALKSYYIMKKTNLPPGARELTMEEAKREGIPGTIIEEGDTCLAVASCPNGRHLECTGDKYKCTIHMVGSGVIGIKCNDRFQGCDGSTSGASLGGMTDKSHMPINGNKL